jgi:glucosamine--fructose-6-phosphate aminotransferase (isomerizing)
MCGIFAYLNYNVSRERRYILEVLLNGLRRLEYRGYDSSGIAVDADLLSSAAATYAGAAPLVYRQEGKIENLVRSVYSGELRVYRPLSSCSFLPVCFALN